MEVVRVLAELGASVETPDNDGNTPAMDVESRNVKPAVPEIALHGWLGVHKEDVPAILQSEKVRLRIYAAGKKRYIGRIRWKQCTEPCKGLATNVT